MRNAERTARVCAIIKQRVIDGIAAEMYLDSTKNQMLTNTSTGTIRLYSYGTHIATITTEDVRITEYWEYSMTTRKFFFAVMRELNCDIPKTTKELRKAVLNGDIVVMR